MEIELNAQLIITLAALIGAVVAIYKYFAASVRFVDRMKLQEAEIANLKKQLEDREKICNANFANQQTHEREELERFRQEVNDELCVVNYGLLACLKGLSEQGCDGPVHEAIAKLEKHLNQKAHK